jgi:ATP-dependent DNA ligase
MSREGFVVSPPCIWSSGPNRSDHDDWIFELKYDGFRALAYIKDGECQIVCRPLPFH